MKRSILIIAMALAATACNSNGTKTTVAKPVEETTTVDNAPIADLFGKEWKLKELNGSPVVLDTTFPKQPHIIFDDQKRAHGNLGCNGFGANVEFTGTDGIKLVEIAATEMACSNLETEQQFRAALESVKSYHIAGSTVTLENEAKQVIAELEHVPNP